MRVLMTADTVGGVWTYATEAVDALARRGVSVTLAVMGRGPSPSERPAAAAAIHEGAFALEWMTDPWDDVDQAGEWLLGLAHDTDADVVHLNGYAHAALPWCAPTLVVGHSCVPSWWEAVKGEEAPAGWDEYRRRVSAGLAAAGTVVAPTRAFLNELVRLYGVGGGRVIPNGRSASWVLDAPKRPFVLGAGRLWDEAKNLVVLDRAAGCLEWPVVLAGPLAGPGGETCQLRSAHGVGALPFTELAGLLCRAAVFAHPARYEPFGLGPLEAGLAGCALVLGDIPTLREVWGGAATYVAPDDVAGWASTLSSLLADPARAAARGADARRRAGTFAPAAMADGYVAAYSELLSSASAA
jgi:glycogen(starch) synthase